MTTTSTLPLPFPSSAASDDAPASALDLCAAAAAAAAPTSSDCARPRVVAAVLASDVQALEDTLWEVARDEVARAASAAEAAAKLRKA